MSIGELLNDLATLKNEAIKKTKIMSENDDDIKKLIDGSIEQLESSTDSCRNPNREVQLPMTKIFSGSIISPGSTSTPVYSKPKDTNSVRPNEKSSSNDGKTPAIVLDPEEGDDTIMNKVVERFEGYKQTFEESCGKVCEIIQKFRQVYKELEAPLCDITKDTSNSYTIFKTGVDALAKPLMCIIDGFQVEEFRKKNLKSEDKISKFKAYLADLNDTFKKYSECLDKFNTESYDIFQKVAETDNLFGSMVEDKLLRNIKKIPGFLNKGILLLPEMAKEISECKKKGDARVKFYDECLTKILNATKDVDSNTYEANKSIEEYMRSLKDKVAEIKTVIASSEKTYMKFAKEIQDYGAQIIYLVNEIRKLFDFPELQDKMDNVDIQFPFYEYVKSLDKGSIKLEEIKEVQKPMKLIMLVFGKQINMVTLDILFIMDITISMADLLQETRNSIKYIVDKIKTDSPGIDIRFAYEGYRDFADLEEGEKYYTIDFMTDYEAFKAQLDEIEAKGGGDDAEDVAGGLDAGLKMSWRSNARYAILIADAPAHGDMYHNEEVQDDYRKGDPQGRKLEDLIKEYINKNINLCVARIDDYTDIMFNIFEKIYLNENINKGQCKFQVVDYNEEGNMEMGNHVAKTAIQIYNYYSKQAAL